ncbi:MAG: hypothetical protein JXR51_02920 [Bacteroidales bacterium]|nr:hypothetical protein [Bacteroidales bacterium]MBN2756102.1 hypothetical protein [Bacteroidales bacterium]
MIVRIFKSFQPINFFIVIFAAIFLWLNVFIDNNIPGISHDVNSGPIYEFIYLLLNKPNLLLINKLIALAIIVFQASLISGINNQYNMLGFRSYFPGLLYILIVSNFNEFKILNPIHFANIFFLLAWVELLKSEQNSNTTSNYFNAAFYIGISSLFYFNYIYISIIIILHLLQNRPGVYRELFVIIAALLLVWYIYFSIFFLFAGNFQASVLQFNFNFNFNIFLNIATNIKIIFSYLILIIITASFHITTYYIGLKSNTRKNLQFLFLIFILNILLLFFTKSTFELIYIIAIPISLFLSLFLFNINKKWISESIFSILLILVIINHAFPKLFLTILN